ncbi:MAG: glutamate--tRNA ligase, partial [Chitinophagaceae bacterium]|nr:glutamate--tRNA ligase [Chitinophagaceae bacterium]
QASFFFQSPIEIDTVSIKPKWDEKKKLFFEEARNIFAQTQVWQAINLEDSFKALAASHQLKTGELMLPLRIMLVGGKFGPGVFEIAEIIGKEQTVKRIEYVLGLL